jgi:hypothetical protein
MEGLVWIIGLVVLAVAAYRWGADSTDGVDSPEWERRRAWNLARLAGRAGEEDDLDGWSVERAPR